MVSIFSWIKNQIVYFIKSIPQIIRGFILFILIISGLVSAILLRLLGQSGIIITIVGIIVEIIALIIIYFISRNYLKSQENSESSEFRKK